MVKIQFNKAPALQAQAEKDLRGKVIETVQQINTDIATLEGTPTNAQVVQILKRVLIVQRAMVKWLAKDLE